MKKLIIATILAAGAISALAQGTVTFNNIGTTYTAAGFPGDTRLVRYGSNVVAGAGAAQNPGAPNSGVVNTVGSAYRAQLYYGASTAPEGSLIPVTSAPALFRSTTTTLPGTWGPVTRTLNGFGTGSTVNMEVKVWDLNFAATYEAALALGSGYGGLLGTSLVFQYTVESDPLAGPGAFLTPNLTSFTINPAAVVPEPATFALAGLGAAALLIFRRRK